MEKKIEDSLKTLSKEQLMKFGLSCIERNLWLYKSMEEEAGKLPKSKSYEVVAGIVDFIRNNIESANKTEIRAQIKKCDRIGDYLAEEMEDFTTLCLISMIDCVLSFYLKEDIQNIILCSENCLEIINQTKSDVYVKQINADADDKELREYLEPLFEQELKTEYEIIEQIKRETPGGSVPIQPKPELKKSKPKKPNDIKNLKAKDFMLQFDPKANILKIGFGVYFYANRGEIKVSEEFTRVNLKPIENLQINEQKRVVEFDTMFKGIKTHFIVKEVYCQTLDIMKFVQQYNENPFKADTRYKDEVAVTIDKDGSNISLGTAMHEKSILLFQNKKYFSLIRYSPDPSMRFNVDSCTIDEDRLSIKHNGLDLYTNEDSGNTEYEWILDVQPEIKDQLIHFIRIALDNNK